ncbi:MAG: MBL fold metallo-hydrolase [Ignavibacteriae bacterium]|nr:MBL fold metallo-hydrolase [Ignavibacteriota bacterium]
MTLEFCGAAQTVTGSQHLLTFNGKRILLDCGMFQGRREEANRINRTFLFDPATIDIVILSHAHIDHSGNLPTLVKNGFTGTIYATPATRDLCSIMLADSAMIQTKDAEYLLHHKGILIEPLYTIDDVSQVMQQFQSIPYHTDFEPIPGVKAKFYDAGHLLGSAITVLEWDEKGSHKRLAFTGDIGRSNRPILKDPDFFGNVDYLICESTYGGRLHEKEVDLRQELLRIIDDVIYKRGKLIIPAFSVGRTQDIIYYLNDLSNHHQLPNIPVFIDSPLAISATHVFRLHPECYNESVRKLLYNDPDPFEFKGLKYTREVVESKRIGRLKKPCVIIAGSGMCESGRVLHHLGHGISKERNTVLFLGYNAPYTLGRKIAQGDKYVNIFGDSHKVRAKVEQLSGLSGHADHDELLMFLSHINASKVDKVFLVHGELDHQEAFKTALEQKGFKSVTIPSKGDIVEL